MIPIDPQEVIKHLDKKSGVIYHFRPLIGKQEVSLLRALDIIVADPRPYIKSAEQEVDSASKGKKWAKGERETAIKKHATEMAFNASLNSMQNIEKEIAAIDNLIDSVLVGWEAGEKQLPKFPADGKPSQFFNMNDRKDLFQIIIDLNSLNGSEARN